jgi:hypothetical protein
MPGADLSEERTNWVSLTILRWSIARGRPDRARHEITVCRVTPTNLEISVFDSPSAARTMVLAR